MKRAVLFQKLQNNLVRCNLCSHRCTISPGKRGLCGVRENHNGTLFSLNYGRAIAVQVDPIEKKPLFHFLPGSKTFSFATAGCNFRCSFCQNWGISQVLRSPQTPQTPQISLSPKEIVRQALFAGCRSISYTYTEPTIFFEYALDTAKLAKKAGLANIFVTNGYQTPETIQKMKGLIDAANIDLKSFSDDFYQKICGARLLPVLESIKLMHKAGLWVEITTLVIPGQNDSPEELTQLAEFIASVDKSIPWHLSRFYPDYHELGKEPTPVETLEKAYQIGKKAGLNFVYVGNVFDGQHESTYCPRCDNLAIRRKDYEVEILGVDQKGHCLKCKENLKIIC